MIRYKTDNLNCYNVKYSPFDPSLIACVTSQNYGFGGHGSLHVIKIFHEKKIAEPLAIFNWSNDGLFDLSWSEINDNIIWTSSADGAIQIWDLNHVRTPINVFKAHDKEISSIEWNLVRMDHPSLLTASWDQTVKQWDTINNQCMQIFDMHQSNVYSVAWSPLRSSTFLSTSGDGLLRVFTTKNKIPELVIDNKSGEILSGDWCKYNDNVIACGTSDGKAIVWDLRFVSNGPLSILNGHNRAVKKIKFSPHQETLIASGSYDFTTRIWDFQIGLNKLANPLLMTFKNHTEFVYGLDFNLNNPKEIVDCSWDSFVNVFDITPFC